MTNKMLTVNPAKVEITIYPRRRRPEEKDVEHLRGVEPHHKIVTANGGKVLVDGAHRILAAQLDGKKAVEVLDLGNITEEEVLRQAVERNSVHGKQLTMAEKQDMAVKFAGAFNVGTLCDMMGVAERTMSRWLAEAKASNRAQIVATALKLIDKGKSVTAIAKQLGVARGTLQGWLKAEANEPKEEDATGAKSNGKPSTGTAKTGSSPSSSKTEPATDDLPVTRADLMKETKELIAVLGNAFVGDCKSALKATDNPDGLHWVDLAKFVLEEVQGKFPQ